MPEEQRLRLLADDRAVSERLGALMLFLLAQDEQICNEAVSERGLSEVA